MITYMIRLPIKDFHSERNLVINRKMPVFLLFLLNTADILVDTYLRFSRYF